VAIRVRESRQDDFTFIREMAYEAAFWRPDQPRPPIDEALSERHFARYLDGWGRRGDVALIAEVGAERAGATWYRLFSADEPGFGFVDETIPELSIAVRRERRGTGVGDALLSALIDRARSEGYGVLSLSVEHANRAVALYERHGFAKVASDRGAWTMRLGL
jgi:GNAT superfamily N-acetyltransferase